MRNFGFIGGLVLMCVAGCASPTNAECGTVTSYLQRQLESDPVIISQRRGKRVVAGEAVSDGDLPWMVSLHHMGRNRHLFCGGTLLTDRVVLTAAHCLWSRSHDQRNHLDNIRVRLGSSRASTNSQYMRIEKFFIPKDFNPTFTYSHDYALLLLTNSTVLTPEISTVCLPPIWNNHKYFNAGTRGVASGWGSTEPWDGISSWQRNLKFSNHLNAVKLQIGNFHTCKDKIRFESSAISSSLMFCTVRIPTLSVGAAANVDIPDICTGDSGGPFVSLVKRGTTTEAVQTGVVSWHEGCGNTQSVHFFTKLNKKIVIRIKLQMRRWNQRL